MTYGGFLALFVAAPAAAFAWRFRAGLRRRGWVSLAALLAVVYALTTPWDQAAVRMGLWGFDSSRTWGVFLGPLPLEEYLFFGLQTVLTGLWVRHRLATRGQAP